MLQRLAAMSPLSLLLATLDILLVAYIFYRILLLVRGTRAIQLIKGLLVLVVLYQVSAWLNLYTTHFLLQTVLFGLLVAIPVVFQPELRRALEHLGQGRFFTEAPLTLNLLPEEDRSKVLGQVVRAAEHLAQSKTGALIVLERETGLEDYVETGVQMDALVSAQLLEMLFIPGTPLHDGAVIIRGQRVVAAACFLPLAEGRDLPVELGSRHRAALGISEQSDALALVVSEETGTISLANGGRLIRHVDPGTLSGMLLGFFRPRPLPGRRFWNRGGS